MSVSFFNIKSGVIWGLLMEHCQNEGIRTNTVTRFNAVMQISRQFIAQIFQVPPIDSLFVVNALHIPNIHKSKHTVTTSC